MNLALVYNTAVPFKRCSGATVLRWNRDFLWPEARFLVYLTLIKNRLKSHVLKKSPREMTP